MKPCGKHTCIKIQLYKKGFIGKDVHIFYFWYKKKKQIIT
jgi:hypothetical protein